MNESVSIARPHRWTCKVVLLALVTVITAGCRHDTAAIAPANIPHYRTQNSSSPRSAARDPRYLHAVALFRDKDYAEARSVIDAMLVEPAWPAGERAFLERQRALCEKPTHSTKDKADGRIAPIARSDDKADCGPRALAIVLESMGKHATVERLRVLAGTDANGTTLAGLKEAITSLGLRAEAVQMDRAALEQWDGEGIAWVDGDHYVAVLAAGGDSTRIHDPNHSSEEDIPTEQLLRRSGGVVLKISRR